MQYQTILLKKATIVNYNNQFTADVFISNGIIDKIAPSIKTNADFTLDVSDKYLFPGFVDPHVHLHLPTPVGFSKDNFYSGSLAALHGGTTSIIDFVTPNRGQSLVEAYLLRIEEAKNSLVTTKFHVSPIEWRDSTADEMTELVEEYGVRSFKIYMAYKKSVGINDEVIIKVLETAKKLNVLVTAHCESGDIIDFLRQKSISDGNVKPIHHALSRPPETELDAVNRLMLFAKMVDTPIYIVHVSTKLAIEAIQKAQREGQKVFAETCPHYLLLNHNCYESNFENSAKYVMSPPLRFEDDSKSLWEAIKSGVISTIGTDHCPFDLEKQKEAGLRDFTKIPNGVGSIEYRIPLFHTYGVVERELSLQKMVEICSFNPAKIFGIPNKGIIEEGFDADLVIFNPQKNNTISKNSQFQNCDSNIYEGFKVIGEIEKVFIARKNGSEMY